MLRFLPLRMLLLVGTALLFICCEPAPPLALVPSDCRPELTRFAQLDRSLGTTGKLPPLPEDATAQGAFYTAELPGVDDDGFILHVHNGTANDLTLRVYGMLGCSTVEPVTDLLTLSALAAKVPVEKLSRRYDRFFVRFTLGIAPAAPPLSTTDFVALAAYDDAGAAPLALECAIDVAVQYGAYLVASAGNYNGDLQHDPQWPSN